ncbi:hypothetical protein CF95_gp209 [Erwinia phage PhiEaH1]|uniref:Uncharacterized protein n=1 Tax=Erwinia phage PhiEaH1 TaxID=1401669 RepID=W8CZQ3_9CAUD|nr:hypothetical protein CF95_gp209 [Erwinia phage PhiEaH1]AGX01931.1 hypothetical protein [Erwinia phage PhiEaH1]WBF04879.1 hypothetical protein [Erwinia phage vB_Ea277G]
MSPRAFSYVMGSGFGAWIICALIMVSIPPERANVLWLFVLITVVPLVVTLIAHRIFRYH